MPLFAHNALYGCQTMTVTFFAFCFFRCLPVRYGDGAIDYTDFCQRTLFDQHGMEALAGKINARFAELR